MNSTSAETTLTARFAPCPRCGVEQVLWPGDKICVECEQGPAEPVKLRGPQKCRQCGAKHTDDNHVEWESETCEACKWEYGCEFVPLRGEKPKREYDQPTECLNCNRGPITPKDEGFCSYGCQKDFIPF